MKFLRLGLSHRLSLLVTLAILLSMAGVAVYFDNFLKDSFLAGTRQRMEHAFSRIRFNLGTLRQQLDTTASLFAGDTRLQASFELINNYQDKQRYNTFLLDEEKKQIAAELLQRVKLSFNSEAVVYDQQRELIAYVLQEEPGYRLNFISWSNGQPLLRSRWEDEADFTTTPYQPHPRVAFDYSELPPTAKVLPDAWSDYSLSEHGMEIRAHRWIRPPEAGRPLAYVELARDLDKRFFDNLAAELNVQLSFSTDLALAGDAASLVPAAGERLKIRQSEDSYTSALAIDSRDGLVFMLVTLDKQLLQLTLERNRLQLMSILGVLAVLLLLVTRLVFERGLARPLAGLMRQIDKIERHDYTPSPVLDSQDELQLVSQNINQLATTIDEREQSLQASQRELRYLSDHDPLTELSNRRFFEHRLKQLLDTCDTMSGQSQPLALLFVDLDQFKNVNDTLGHNVGDELLVQVARRLLRVVREGDTLARIGGDEFILLVVSDTRTGALSSYAKVVLGCFDVPFHCSGHDINIHASIGIASHPEHGSDSITLIKHADLAMYEAKARGRNRYRFFSEELFTNLQRRTEIISAMERALANGKEFELHYQPKLDAITGGVIGIEALIRWRHPQRGLLGPAEFIPIAEESRLIIPLGSFILRKACEDFMTLARQGIQLVHVSVNVSSIQLLHSNMILTLEAVLRETGIPPQRLELEITESYIATDTEDSLATLAELRRLQVQLAVDDFGTGYSSMSYLHRLPVTRLKIDKSFIDGLPQDFRNGSIVLAVITLAQAFDLSTTAEGVENEQQLEFLRAARCDEVQGYYYSRPLELDALIQFCRQRGTWTLH